MVTHITFNANDALIKKIRLIQARLIVESNKNISLSETLNLILCEYFQKNNKTSSKLIESMIRLKSN